MKMRISEVRNRDQKIQLTPQIKEYLEHQIHKKLKNYHQKIASIHVELKDINGPHQAGLDKQCRLEVFIPALCKRLKVSQLERSIHKSIQQASSKMADRLSRQIQMLENKTQHQRSYALWSQTSSLRM